MRNSNDFKLPHSSDESRENLDTVADYQTIGKSFLN